MRWVWIDRLIALEPRRRCEAVKNASLADAVMFDVMARSGRMMLPQTLIIEGMAQTAGILVGHARDFAHPVLLAKVSKARFHGVAGPGMTLHYTAHIDHFDDAGAAARGTVQRIDPLGQQPTTEIAHIDLLFTHFDHARPQQAPHDGNFVFTGLLRDLVDNLSESLR